MSDGTLVAGGRAHCPKCAAPLEPSTCTMGAVVICGGCRAAVSMVVKASKEGFTLVAALAPRRPDRLPGDLGQRFEVVSRLGAGGQGEVLRVRPRGATRDYALKWNRIGGPESLDDRPARSGGAERGPREANYAAMPAHPNVLAPIQAGWFENHQYMVFDLVEGETLADVLARDGALPPARACELAHQLLRALAHVHANSVIHRDVKPANLLVTPDGLLRLTDFGVATSVGTPAGEWVIGTPDYMSPEQVTLEPPLPASDVFAAGCVLFEMLTGRAPFTRDTLVETLSARLTDPAPDVRTLAPAVGEPLAKFVQRCLARAHGARPRDGGEALRELAAAQRACELAEHVDLVAVPQTGDRQGALMRQRAMDRLRTPFLEAAVSVVLLLWSLAGAADPVRLWPGVLFALALLGHALPQISAGLTGDAQAWVKAHIPGDLNVWLDYSPVMITSTTAFVVTMIVIIGFNLAGWILLPVIAYCLAAVLAARGLSPAFAELTSPMPELAAGAPPELRVFMPEDGWSYRLLPGGAAAALPHRILLAEGLNRVEVWRGPGKKRVFLIWAAAGMQLAMQIRDTADGPLASSDRRAALPPPPP